MESKSKSSSLLAPPPRKDCGGRAGRQASSEAAPKWRQHRPGLLGLFPLGLMARRPYRRGFLVWGGTFAAAIRGVSFCSWP